MTKTKKIGLIVFIIIVVIAAVSAYFIVKIQDDLDYLSQMPIVDVDLSLVEDGEYISTILYDSVEYNWEKRTLLLHIYYQEGSTYDDTVIDPIDLDYYILIEFTNTGLTYYHQYGTDEEVQSDWQISNE